MNCTFVFFFTSVFSSQLVHWNVTVRHIHSYWNGRKNMLETRTMCFLHTICNMRCHYVLTYYVNLPSFNCIYRKHYETNDEHCMRNHERLFIVPCIVILLWSFLSFQFNSSNVLHDNILNSRSHYHVLRTETETFGKYIYKEKTRRNGKKERRCSHIGHTIPEVQESRY